MSDSLLQSEESSPLLGTNASIEDDRSARKQNSDRERKMALAQIKPFLRIAIPFFRENRAASCCLFGLVCLTLVNSAMTILFSYVKRDLYDALSEKDEETFYKCMLYFLAVLVVAVPIAVFYSYLRARLALSWREALTARVLEKYYSKRSYYILETLRDIDNPDQRIAEDVSEFTSTSLAFFFVIFDAIVNLISFSVVLFQIYPSLFVAIVGYAALGTVVTCWLGSSLSGLYYDNLQSEADFRFGLIRTRENAEGIAFYDSKATLEKINVWSLFKRVLKAKLCIIQTQRNLEFFTTSFDYIAYIVPTLVVAPLYFKGLLDFGAISQSSEAFYNVRSDLSIVVNYYEDISNFSAGMNRLQTFIDRIAEGGWQPIAAPTAKEVEAEGTSSSSWLCSCCRHLACRCCCISQDQSALPTHAVTSKFNSNGKSAPQMTSLPLMTMTVATTTPMLSLASPIHASLSGAEDEDEVILQCLDLTLLTPDGSRVLIGGMSRRGPNLEPPAGSRDKRSGVLAAGLSSLSIEASASASAPRGVNLTVLRGDRLLLEGPSGCGKSSLIRAMAGLWEVGYGQVLWGIATTGSGSGGGSAGSTESSDGLLSFSESSPFTASASPHMHLGGNSNERLSRTVFFLPQKPYNLMGSLRQQIMYPSVWDEDSNVSEHVDEDGRRSDGWGRGDSELLDILKQVRLERLAARVGGGDAKSGLNVHRDWSKVLSLGEQQRLAFARVLFNSPSVVVLDESTSALDADTEAAMYALLVRMHVTYISVSHNTAVTKFHSKKLVLRGPGEDIECEPIHSNSIIMDGKGGEGDNERRFPSLFRRQGKSVVHSDIV